jgi:lysophospholipid acyltransferase (LPLAT)-like uncharacterized protein
MFRRLIRHPSTQAALARLLGLYLLAVYRTTRWTVLGEEHLRAALRPEPGQGRPAVVAFWHETLPMIPPLLLHARRLMPEVAAMGAHVLVSRHRDGRFVGAVVRRYGVGLVHASTSRGGVAGLRSMLRLLAAGDIVGVTPDGPRGPRRVAAPGVAQLAALSGRPVLPCAGRSTRQRVLGSWDRMRLPLPFGRGVLVCGPPMTVPRDRQRGDAALAAIAAALSAACDAADAWAP